MAPGRVLLVLACVAMAALQIAATASAAKAKPQISVLSNRADLVSDGQALVEIKLPKGSKASKLVVKLRAKGRTRDITRRIRRRGGRIIGTAKPLLRGRNRLIAKLGKRRSRVVITSHPNGGPVFSGPQVQPWECQEDAINRKCDEPPEYRFLYASTDQVQKPGLSRYDPQDPPGDVATTTTDKGVEVPFVVRQELGYQDRDQYKILTLFTPGAKWNAWRPQKQWNGKVLVTHGGGCGVSYETSSARLDDYAGTFPPNPALDNSYVAALGKGFMVLSTALDNTGHNCHLATAAESLLMAKERIVERYGEIRYTIGTGCSGGSLAQHWIANAYPGIYQGILPTCSFPDAISTGAQFADYHGLRLYFETPARWGPGVVWNPAQMGAVAGHPNYANVILSDEEFFKIAVNPLVCPGELPEAMRYHPDTNPGGVRCSVLDFMVNIFGPRPPSEWTAAERKIGRGYVGAPIGNVGVQYGLKALQTLQITPEQFVDLNEQAGALDVDLNRLPERAEPSHRALRRAYRSGTINHANNLENVAAINAVGIDPGLAHDAYRAFTMRERVRREQGHADNYVLWGGPAPLIGDIEYTTQSLFAMDRWLAAVEADRRRVPLAQKIREDRPANVHDQCSDGFGQKILDELCPELALGRFATARMVAGDSITTEANQCRLRPLERGEYTIPFSDSQWSRLQKLFPGGVCDYGKPPVGSRDTVPWLGYFKKGRPNRVRYGGRRLGKAPARSGYGMTSASFREWLRP